MAGKRINKKKELLDEKQVQLKKIGNRLRQIRKDHGYTSAEKLANDKGLNRTQYTKYEAGKDDMRITSLLKAIAALGISPADFFKDFK